MRCMDRYWADQYPGLGMAKLFALIYVADISSAMAVSCARRALCPVGDGLAAANGGAGGAGGAAAAEPDFGSVKGVADDGGAGYGNPGRCQSLAVGLLQIGTVTAMAVLILSSPYRRAAC